MPITLLMMSFLFIFRHDSLLHFFDFFGTGYGFFLRYRDVPPLSA
jgi:hypothetical protein